MHGFTKITFPNVIEGGVETIDRGDNGDEEIFNLIKFRNVALCATLAAGDAIKQYNGWIKGPEPEPNSITEKRKSLQMALKSGVTIAFGDDVGVYTHGDNTRELELMVDYGMPVLDVLRFANSVNAKVFHQGEIGQIKAGFKADLIVVEGDPSKNISQIRKVKMVMKNGVMYQ